MLELLAGPVDITHGESTAYLTSPARAMWADGIGVISSIHVGTQNIAGTVIGLDGVARKRHARSGLFGAITHNLADRCLAVWHSTHEQFETADSYIFHPQTEGFATGVGAPWAVLPDRWLMATGTKIRTVARGSAATPTDEYTLPVTLGSTGAGWITPGTRADRVMIGGPAGVAYEYDYVAEQLVGFRRHFGMACADGVFYSKALGVWITLSRTSSAPIKTQMRVWADEVAPASLAAPAALSSVLKGRAVEVRTRLLGASSEPCAGMLINWSVTAGDGEVSPTQSTTDADGYASTMLIEPPDASGSATVEAEAVF